MVFLEERMVHVLVALLILLPSVKLPDLGEKILVFLIFLVDF